MDIDEKEMIVRFRRKRIIRKLLKVSSKEIAKHIFCLVRENCEGCSTTFAKQIKTLEEQTGMNLDHYYKLKIA